MEEFDNLPRTRRPRQYTYRGSYRRPGSIPGGFNPAADVLSCLLYTSPSPRDRG